jgi:hypothetical protein
VNDKGMICAECRDTCNVDRFNFPLKDREGGGKGIDEDKFLKYSDHDKDLAITLRKTHQERNKRRAALRRQNIADENPVEMKAEEKRKASKLANPNRSLVAAASMKRQKIAFEIAKSLLPDATPEEVRSCPPFLVFLLLYLPSPFLVFLLPLLASSCYSSSSSSSSSFLQRSRNSW